MTYTATYHSPLGELLLAADEAGLTGLWFEGQKYYAPGLSEENEPGELPVFEAARRWLDTYFAGRDPGPIPPVHLQGTDFQKKVWQLLCEIPYGKTVTYGYIAGRLAGEMRRDRMSAQAVGQAVGHNPVGIIVPCHRVVGSGGSLTGYAGGIDRKVKLLRLEGAMRADFFVPKNAAAP